MSPRERQTFAVLAFPTTHDALSAESLLKDMGVDVVPIPSPKSLGALCGIAMRIPPGQVARAEELLERAGISLSARGEIEDV